MKTKVIILTVIACMMLSSCSKSEDSYNHGTFTLLVNADGTPMIYEGE